MSSVFIVVRRSSVNLCQGFSVPNYSLQMLGDYYTKLTHPAFTSEDKANEYLLRLPKTESFCLEVFEIQLKE